jgi:hypothetical protein
MSRGISLRRRPQDRVWVNNRGEGFRLRIEAYDAVNMPAEIFLHQQTLVDPLLGESGEEFVCICSCFDLTIYPANVPDATQFPQFYRKSVLDIILPSQSVAEEAWTAIYDEVCLLKTSLDKLDRLSLGETVRCGDPVEEPPSSISESISASET